MKKIKLINNITKFKLFALLFLNLKAGQEASSVSYEDMEKARTDYYNNKTEEERERLKNTWNPVTKAGVNNVINGMAFANKAKRQEKERQEQAEKQAQAERMKEQEAEMKKEKLIERAVEQGIEKAMNKRDISERMDDYFSRKGFSKFNK